MAILLNLVKNLWLLEVVCARQRPHPGVTMSIYARWIPIHLRDMMVLEEQHPNVAIEFHKGNFVIHKSRRDSSAMAIDQVHEKNNEVIKGEGVLLA